MTINKKISGLICVSSNDVSYLFDYVLISTIKNILFIDTLYIITPDPQVVINKLSELSIKSEVKIIVVADTEILSKKELELCGWSRQQIIKLRSHKLCPGKDILSIGADTVILRPMELESFYKNNELIINYRNHTEPSKHCDFEIERCKNICSILGITPTENILRDYIFDLFFLKEDVLILLESYLTNKFGEDCYLNIFPKIVNDYSDMVKTGEWTLYTLFVIGILKTNYSFRNATSLVHQIHSNRELANYDYTGKSVHFVRKDFNKDIIFSNIKSFLLP